MGFTSSTKPNPGVSAGPGVVGTPGGDGRGQAAVVAALQKYSLPLGNLGQFASTCPGQSPLILVYTGSRLACIHWYPSEMYRSLPTWCSTSRLACSEKGWLNFFCA